MRTPPKTSEISNATLPSIFQEFRHFGPLFVVCWELFLCLRYDTVLCFRLSSIIFLSVECIAAKFLLKNHFC